MKLVALALVVPMALLAIPDKPEAAQDPAILPGCQEWRDVDYLALAPKLSRANRTDRPKIRMGSIEQLEGYATNYPPSYCPTGVKPWTALVRAYDYHEIEMAFTDYDPDPAETQLVLGEWLAYLSGGPAPSKGIIFLRVRDFRVYWPPGPNDYLIWSKVQDTNLPQGATGSPLRWDGWYEDGEHGSGEITQVLRGMNIPCAKGYLATLLSAAQAGNVNVQGLLTQMFAAASAEWEALDQDDDGYLDCSDVPGWQGVPSHHWTCAATPPLIYCERDIPAWIYLDAALEAVDPWTW